TIHSSQHAGNSSIDSVAFSLLGTGSIRRAYLEAGLLGAFNNNHSSRHIFFPGFDAHAKASFDSWQLVPHAAFGYDLVLKDWIIEPFASADCVVTLQDGFSERGAAPLNMGQPHSTSELLQTRLGMRAYLSGCRSWGLWLCRIMGAYQYKKGWDVG